ncbi:hypothetical protein ES703_43287 [subsurface metagenome]
MEKKESQMVKSQLLEEAKWIRDYFTPLSVFLVLQVSLLLYFLDKGWTQPLEYGWPFFGIMLAIFALTGVLVYGFNTPLAEEERQPTPLWMHRIRRTVDFLTFLCLVTFFVSIVVIRNKFLV